jgi:predicted alpha/beta hydrolase family esterase
MSCIRVAAAALVGVAIWLGGCSRYAANVPTDATSTVLVVNGADGPGPWYNGLVDGLERGGAADRVEMVNWGAPWLAWTNLSFSPLHSVAEKRLISRIQRYREQSPDGQITLVGHSAGCGVILDALKHLPAGQQVDTVILLAPAVSKGYDLTASLDHVRGKMHAFYSDRDQLLLRFSVCLTGTYDHVWSNAAGYAGFVDAAQLPDNLRPHLVQHSYEKDWKQLGHLGGHFGYRSPRFAAEILAPLAAAPVPSSGVFARQKPLRNSSPVALLPTTRPIAH